jgi:2-amino-4-hydroxy-6-hydroxymethyldihydropteridine diphosphokinase
MSEAVLSLGSNLGDRLGQLRAAVAALGDAVVAVSAVYETPPWGDPDQATYLNAAVHVRAGGVPPRAWLDRAMALERAAGRTRDPGRRFGPRTLDVDVIAVWTDDGQVVTADDPDWTVPHPRAHLRAFVLRPWLDLDPDAVLPGHGRVADLLTGDPVAADLAAIRRTPDSLDSPDSLGSSDRTGARPTGGGNGQAAADLPPVR